MITMKATVACVAALVASNAVASKYDSDRVEISRDDGVAVSLSASSLDRKGDRADVLVKLVYDRPASTLRLGFPTEKVISQWSIDCASRTAAIGRSTGYGVQPDEVNSIDGRPDNFRTYKPRTFGYAITQFVCATSRPRATCAVRFRRCRATQIRDSNAARRAEIDASKSVEDRMKFARTMRPFH
ncbi:MULTISPECIES: hypothetical protein [Burkholderia]|uniref:hypothetical protein n=1 Tax=Burkholderia TaxID=32008 RepID=UPI00104E7033|nr:MULTISPECIES: hypothetical protein [Burkholderia]ELK6464388.1 hypothetical protein [Burkholderia contaminans]